MNIIQAYRDSKKRKRMYLFLAVSILLLVIVISSTIRLEGSRWQLFYALYHYFTGTVSIVHQEIDGILLVIRLPRIVMALLAGCALAVAGCVMQSVTRNALASPFTTGVAAASTFGAAVGIVIGANTLLEVILYSFSSSMTCILLVYIVAYRSGISAANVVLVGIGLNYLFSAFTESIRFYAKGYQLEALIQWSFGTLARAHWDGVFYSALATTVCCFLLYRYHVQLDILSSNGDEAAKSLGVNTDRIRFITGAIAVFMTATVLCFTGVIGFVGLIAPHISRSLIGAEHRYGLPFSALVGMILVLTADTIGHYALPPNDIPVGVVMSFLGVPLFIHLVLKKRKTDHA